MIQGLAKKLAVPASRRVYAVLIAALLNLALVPCAMALEVIEEGHDCCPAEVNLELPECCELDDVSVDKRDGLLELWDAPDTDDVAPDPRSYSASDPPDPPGRAEARHKLFCIYLI
ncbi:MAG: hypothetical protein GWP62_13785 [Gammaproteobacteria bacterium]|nr:hypothetical protein [Gammaproteobacteria bacterium]